MNRLTRVPYSIVTLALVACLSLLFPWRADADPSSSPGMWAGNLSGAAFSLKIWNVAEHPNATITYDSIGEAENLTYLGSKAGIDYFFRISDKAAISIYQEGGATLFSYFEKGIVRTVTLTRK